MRITEPTYQSNPGSKRETQLFFQPKLAFNSLGDEHERETSAITNNITGKKNDAKADGFLNAPSSQIQRKCQQCEEEENMMLQKKDDTSAITSNEGATKQHTALNSNTGSPMQPQTKNFFESRMGYDFSAVRLHTGSAAEQSAKSVNALAYTQGNNIVFGANQYSPGTNDGKKLLAHELTHVIQQKSANHANVIQRQPAGNTAMPAYEKEATDLVTRLKASGIKLTGGSTVMPAELSVAEKYVALTEAIATGNTPFIMARLRDFYLEGPKKLPMGFPSRGSVGEMVAKLITLGLESEAASLERFFPEFQHDQGESEEGFNLKIFLLQTVTDKLPDVSKIKDAAKASEAADAWWMYIKHLSPQLASIDQGAVKKEIDERSKGKPVPRHDYSILTYASELFNTFLFAFTQFQLSYQMVLDKAISDLQQNRGDKFLQIAKAKLNAIAGFPLPELFLSKQIETTKTSTSGMVEKGAQARYLDYFTADKPKARSVDIDFYDPEFSGIPDEKTLLPARIIEIRQQQISALENLYGFEKDNSGKLTADTKENAAAIKKAGGLTLEDDDSWRKFLLAKYNEHKKANGGDKEKAYKAVMDTIRLYMGAFTSHTPNNIVDGMLNQLTIQYPRALTGQLIHDCGVYALRMVYMLSLLKDSELHLTIQFVRLPQHASLVITGKGLPTYFAQNNEIMFVEQSKMAGDRVKWDQASQNIGLTVPPGAAGDNQFLGEIAAENYIHGADMPYRVSVLPKDANFTRASLWRFYKDNVVPDIFTGDVSSKGANESFYRYNLKYKEVLDTFKQFYNSRFVPFWNDTVVKNWAANKAALQAASAAISSAPPEKKAEEQAKFKALFDNYTASIMAGFDVVKKDFEPIEKKIADLNKTLRTNSSIKSADAEISNSDRIAAALNDWLFIQKETALDLRVNMQDDPREIIATRVD